MNNFTSMLRYCNGRKKNKEYDKETERKERVDLRIKISNAEGFLRDAMQAGNFNDVEFHTKRIEELKSKLIKITHFK